MSNNNGNFQAMPFILQGSQQPYQDRLRAEVPPRVKLACSLLEQMMVKTSVHMASESDSHDGFNSFKGQTLTVEEEQAQASALALLTQYFNGKLKECSWDGVRDNQAEESEEPKLWNEMPCPACSSGNPVIRNNCVLCGNAGKVRVARVS